MQAGSTVDFLARARQEAARYGDDPWVLVRELVQNARDAGATRVCFTTATAGGRERVSCLDDGHGMTLDHARRYLFTLYASSKRGQSGSAGRFGIGFWSVLRFAPETIVVRSRPRAGTGWEVVFDEALQGFRAPARALDRGTEIVLERPSRGIDLRAAIVGAVLRDAPFVTRRDRPRVPLEITVDGRGVRSTLELPPPSLSFSRRGLRGAVSLGSAPGVEIYSHGLRVRGAASLDELTLASKVRRQELPASGGGLSPRAVIDSADLSVLMARGDAGEDRALRRLVRVGHRELRHLVRAELDRHGRVGIAGRAAEWLRGSWSDVWLRRIAAATAAAAVAGVIGGLAARHVRHAPAPAGAFAPNTAPAAPAAGAVPYRSLAEGYRGPSADDLGGVGPAIELEYRPATETPLFAALVLAGVDPDGAVAVAEPAGRQPYRGAPCIDRCLEVEVVLAASDRLLPVPIATGHLLDPSSVRLDGRRVALTAGLDGRPLLAVPAAAGSVLRYRSGRGAVRGEPREGNWPPLPATLQAVADELFAASVTERAEAAAAAVRAMVEYDRSPETAELHRRGRHRGEGLFERTLRIGRGDCDLQNVLVAAVLDRSGVPARLAVGWIGIGGRVEPGLHAWVEFQEPGGRWHSVDASAGGAGGGSVAVSGDSESAVEPRRGGAAWASPLAVVTALAALAGAALLAVRPWQRQLRKGGETDLSELLRGAAVRPGDFARVPALFTRPVVPVVGGRAAALRRLFAAADQGALACGVSDNPLAQRAASAGAVVVDHGRPEGEAVATALAATDLDRWQALLAGAVPEGVANRVERALSTAGDECLVRVARGVGEDVGILDGSAVGLGSCWVVVDRDGELWQAARRLQPEAPAAAALLVAEAAVRRLGLPEASGRRLLAPLAAAAVAEAAVRM